MSERQRTLFKRACGLLIAGAFVLLAIVFALKSETPPIETRSVKVVEPSAVRRVQRTPPSPVMEVSETYYRTIIENNLFRPLGWMPPRPVEPYRLLGTIDPTDVSSPPRAILQTTAGKTAYIVSVGDRLDTETKVVSIEGKAVVLETAGEQRTLHLSIVF